MGRGRGLPRTSRGEDVARCAACIASVSQAASRSRLPAHRSDGRAPVFTGRAHTLAGSSRDTQAPRSAVKRYVVVFYANGVFTVDDGPARSVEDPANMGFIVAISRGERPRELKVRA